MPHTTRFKSEYLSVLVSLGPLTLQQFDALSEAEQELHHTRVQVVQDAAYALVEQRHRSMPGYLVPYQEHDMSYEVEQFELCENDSLLEPHDGKMTLGICFFTEQQLPAETVENLKQLVLTAYREACEQHSMSMEPVHLERQVTEEHILTTTVAL